jgi:hypothetical protein
VSVAGHPPSIEHGSSTVGFEQYKPVLEAAKSRLPIGAQPTLLADRGFDTNLNSINDR